MASPGLVPGPPGPNIGELKEEGELEVDGELEEAGWAELLSPPPHPAIVIEAHTVHRQPRVENHLAIAVCDEMNDAGFYRQGMECVTGYQLAASPEV